MSLCFYHSITLPTPGCLSGRCCVSAVKDRRSSLWALHIFRISLCRACYCVRVLMGTHEPQGPCCCPVGEGRGGSNILHAYFIRRSYPSVHKQASMRHCSTTSSQTEKHPHLRSLYQCWLLHVFYGCRTHQQSGGLLPAKVQGPNVLFIHPGAQTLHVLPCSCLASDGKSMGLALLDIVLQRIG